MSRPISKNQMADFWYENYLNNGACGLCGNSGVIETTVRTAAGVSCGGRFWCVCPNGRTCARVTKTKRPNQ